MSDIVENEVTPAGLREDGARPSKRLALYMRSVRSGQGTERVVVNIARGLAARGHTVDLLLEDTKGHLLEDLPESVSIVQLKGGQRRPVIEALAMVLSLARNLAPGLRPGRARLPGFLTAFSRFLYNRRPPLSALRLYIARQHPTAVLAFLPYPCLSLLLAKQLGTGRTSILISIRNNITQSVSRAKSRRMREVPVLMQSFYPLADRIVVVSDGVRTDAVQWTGLPSTRFKTIYNPVYRPELLELAKEAVGHDWLGEAADRPVIVAAGKLKPQKDFETLLRAFAELIQEKPARLVILGEGEGRARLQALAAELGVKDEVDLPGHVTNPYAFFSRASVFVLSSAWEGLPNVLIEAMACGCPVVSTDCPSGPMEILENGRFGSLVPVGDAAGMAAAIRATLDDPPARDRLRNRARNYSLEGSVATYEAVMLDPRA